MPDPDSDHLDPAQWIEQLEDERAWLREFARGQIRGKLGELDSEDLVQEAHARGLAQCSRLHFENRRSLRAWLALVVRNLVRDRQRKRTPESLEVSKLNQAIDSTTSPSAHMVKSELGRILKELISELDPKSSAIVKMRIWDERTFAEIGEALSVSEGHARVSYHRSMKHLRTQLRPTSRESQ